MNTMPIALFLSPHLDDVVFSCGGFAAGLADAGWRTVLITVFTQSVVPASGFALACQLDKGLGPDVDYMALRRGEDTQAASILSFGDVRWLELPEAPHRGYNSAAELFGTLHEQDSVEFEIAAKFIGLAAELQPDLVLAPQGLGNHVDHQQVIKAANHIFPAGRVAYYRDTPYAIRQPGAIALPSVPAGVASTIPIAAALDRKIAAAQAYTSQVGFQFGGNEQVDRALRAFAVAEGNGVPCERFCGRPLGTLLHSAAA